MCGIQTHKGFVTLTGEVGTGKTTLLNRLLSWLHNGQTKTALLFNSGMNTSQFFDFVLAEFAISSEAHDKSQQLMRPNNGRWIDTRPARRLCSLSTCSEPKLSSIGRGSADKP
jgi:general secretion pathway protein A